MPNKSSDSGHIPLRTCVVCRTRNDQKALLAFYKLGSDLIFDIGNIIHNRKKYVCHTNECLSQIDTWLNKQLKKNRKLKLNNVKN